MATKSSLTVILNEVKNPSRSRRPKKVTGIRWVSALQSSLPGAPAVQGVALACSEDVQWTWTHTANGNYVSGYSIAPKRKRSGRSRRRISQ